MQMLMDNHIISGQQKEKENEFIGGQLSDFEILQTLGKGSYGYVAKVKSKINEKLYAMKMIDFELIKDQTEKDLSLNEIKVIQKLDSPHIIKYYNCFSVGKKLYILMEYMNNGDMKGYISAHQNMGQPIPEDELWSLFYQSMSGLACIHKSSLIHRDIKPANLFLTDEKTIKIGDFGVSASRKKDPTINGSKEQKETMMIGTPLYMAPEMFNHEKYGSKVDIYALGCTFHEMCYYTPPRIPVPVMNMNLEITTNLQDVEPKFNKGYYSQELNNLLHEMLEKDQKKRKRTNEIFDIIKKQYNMRFRQNLSIFVVYKCLLSFDILRKKIIKHEKDFNSNAKPISFSFLLALKINNNNNWPEQLIKIRDILTYNNTSFIDPGEIEPEDLIEYTLKCLHIENNKVNSTYSRLFSLEEDPAILNRQAIFKKYLTNFQNYFKSFIADNFYGCLETIKTCSVCGTNNYFFDSYYYLTLDINQAIKCSINPNNQNFIIDCLKKQLSLKINKLKACKNCGCETNHIENKKINSIPTNLIISIRNEGKNVNMLYPLSLEFSFLNLGYEVGQYKLTGVIKKLADKGKKEFVCIYKDIQTPQNLQWMLSDGYSFSPLISHENHNIGSVVMLFYEKGQ